MDVKKVRRSYAESVFLANKAPIFVAGRCMQKKRRQAKFFRRQLKIFFVAAGTYSLEITDGKSFGKPIDQIGPSVAILNQA